MRLQDTAFDIREANTAQQFMENLTDEERATLRRMHDDERLYHHMVESICPQVFGHENIKRGVLLMLYVSHSWALFRTAARLLLRRGLSLPAFL
jgi:DNA replicative helicase MCM subunit Mcm2 (Cdc46/Mcm family)